MNDNLMVVPERKLIKLYQAWLNNRANTEMAVYRMGLPIPSFETGDKEMEPIKNEIQRRSRLVLK